MNLEQVLNKAIEKAVKQAKLELYPVGSYWITEGSQNPADVIGGGGMGESKRSVSIR